MNAANRSVLFQSFEKLFREQQTRSFLVGFDGFIDEIVTCVDTRHSHQQFTSIDQMANFAKRLLEASGKSCNVELVTTQRKIGGNAPILAEALIRAGNQVALIGSLGYPKIDPLFEPLTKKCTACYSIANSGHTDALEFSDGKILLGKLASMLTIDVPLLLDRVGKKQLISLIEHADLFACTNWTMIAHMTEIWRFLDEEIFPLVPEKTHKRWMFVDLADPAKRPKEDLLEALMTLKRTEQKLQVCLGLNLAEAEQVAKVLDINILLDETSPVETQKMCQALQQTLELQQIVIHATTHAAAASSEASNVINGPYCKKPLLTTGGGDNFNAGYCLGLVHELGLQESLLLGAFTSGFYVRFGKSPSLQELRDFCIK